jgi:molybdopterin molybdotransferase
LPQHSQPLELAEALRRVQSLLQPPGGTEQLALNAAHNRIVASNLLAPVDLPPFAASAMDGYAVRASDFATGARFNIVGESLAGHPFTGRVKAKECVRIFTGAQMPAETDLVVLQEEVAERDGASVRFNDHTPAEKYIRPPAHDVARGTRLARPGSILDSFMLGTLSAAGIAQAEVYRRPRVGVFSTGDELVDPGTPPDALAPGQIYDSNRLTVLHLLSGMPLQLVDLGRLPDDATETRKQLAAASEDCNALITSGGVSVGDADFVTTALRSLGQLEFWKLNLKPGKPMAFGRIGQCLLFGLPGNPVSTIVTLLLVAKPALWALAGTNPPSPFKARATLRDALHHTPGRTEYQRGTTRWEDGSLVVTHTGDQSSNRLHSFAGANCLIEVPGPTGDLDAGDEVTVLPFQGLVT